MTRLQNFGKRSLALVLSALLLFSCVDGALVQLVRAEEAWDATTTDGKLMASAYSGLTDGEKALLKSGLLKESSYTYNVPSAEDELVSVNTADRIITAKSKTIGGYTWYPAYAVVENGNDRETVALTKDGNVYTGSFETTGNTYSVSVTFEMQISVSAEKQNALLNAGENLQTGLENLDTIANAQVGLDELAKHIDMLNTLATDGYAGGYVKYTGVGAVAIMQLYAQKVNNGGKLDLTVFIEEYNSYTTKTLYLMQHAKKLIDSAKATATYINLLALDKANLIAAMQLAETYNLDLGVSSTDMAEALDLMVKAANKLSAVTSTTWAVHENNPLRANMLAGHYVALDRMMQNLPENPTAVTVKEDLNVEPVTLKLNMNRYDVTVKVIGQVIAPYTIGANTLTTMELTGNPITLDMGATPGEIAAAIAASGIEAQAQAQWGLDMQHFTVKVIGNDSELTADRTVVITYMPVKYNVSGLVDGPVYYGYNLILPSYENNTKVYNYTINGNSYMQGEIYTVTGDTEISRTVDDPWTETTWGAEVAAVLGKEAGAVLKSAALDMDSLLLRVPANKQISVRLEEDRYVVTAPNYKSGISGLEWVATSAVYVEGGQEIPFNIAEGFTCVNLDKVKVTYTLELMGQTTPAEVLYLMNLPHVLVGEFGNQKAQMSQLMATKSTMGDLNKGVLKGLQAMIADDNRVTEESKQALATIIDECFNSGNQLYLYEYLCNYEADGMVWYYTGTNFETLNAEFKKLRAALNVFLAGNEAIEELLIMNNMGEYYERIDELMTRLNAIELVAPNAVILRDSAAAKLNELVTALTNATGKTQAYTTAANIVKTQVLEAVAPDKAMISIQVVVKDSTGRIVETVNMAQPMIFPLNYVLTEQNILNLQAALAALEAELDIYANYHFRTGTLPEAGTAMTENLALTFVWQPTTISATIQGSGEISFTIDNPYITLPGTGNDTEAYRYNVGGTIYEVRSQSQQIALNRAQMDALLASGTITRELVNLVRMNLLNLVESLNASLEAAGVLDSVKFVALEDANGKIAIVLQVAPWANTFDAAAAATAILETFVSTGYGYIAVDGNVIMDTQVFMQGAIDMLLSSGLSLDGLDSVINSDGTIVNTALTGYAVVGGGNADNLGGLLYNAPMQISDGGVSGAMNVELFVTLSDDGSGKEKLSELDAGINTLKPYVEFYLAGGDINLTLNLPEKAYQAFLAIMIANDQIELDEVNSLDHAACIKYLYELIAPVLENKNVTSDTLENTAGIVGVQKDLSAAQSVISMVQDIYGFIAESGTFSGGTLLGDTYIVDIIYPANNILNKLPVNENLLSLIAEKDQNLEAGMAITVTNINAKYEALVIDLQAPGLKKADFVADAAAAVAQAHKGSFIILVDDVDGDLVAGSSVILDLNGKTVSGDVTGKIHLMDSTVGDASVIEGTTQVVRDYRKTNLYETVVDETGAVNVYINSSLLALDERPGLINFAVNLSLDLIMNYYTSAALNLNGDVIFSLDLDDLMGMIEDGVNVGDVKAIAQMFKLGGMANFVKDFLQDVGKLGDLISAMENDQPMMSYTITTEGWMFNTEYNEEGDFFDGGFTHSGKEQTLKLNILLGGEEAHKQAVIDSLKRIDNIFSLDVDVDFNELNFGEDGLTVGGGVDFALGLNVTEFNEFSVALAVILANNSADKSQYIAAIKDYYNNGSVMALKNILDNATMQDIFAAIKSIHKGTDLVALVESLGLEATYEGRAITMMRAAQYPLLAVSKVLRVADVTGTAAKLGDYEMDSHFGVYCLDKEFEKAGKISVMDGEIALGAKLTVSLFAPEPSFDGFTPEITVDNTNLLGYRFDEANGVIYLDTGANGITATQLQALMTHEASNADSVTVSVNADGLNGELVCNGAVVTFTATAKYSAVVDTVSYKVVILGDINSDGRVSIADAVMIMTYIQGDDHMTDDGKLAANCNMDTRISIADAVLVMAKIQNNYESILR